MLRLLPNFDRVSARKSKKMASDKLIKKSVFVKNVLFIPVKIELSFICVDND